MQIVIDIPEGVKNDFEYEEQWTALLCAEMREALRQGTPLPKGHGRLIDADYLRDALLHNYHGNNKYFVPYQDRKGYRLRDGEVDETIINAPTIIEADKEGEDDRD